MLYKLPTSKSMLLRKLLAEGPFKFTRLVLAMDLSVNSITLWRILFILNILNYSEDFDFVLINDP